MSDARGSLHRIGLGAGLTLLIAFVVMALGPRITPDAADAAPAGSPPSPAASRGEEPFLGFAINAHHISDLPLYLRSVDRIAEMGANALVVVTPWYQKRAKSNDIRHLPRRCPTDEQLLALLARGREHGLRTFLLPIVLLEDTGENDWRGVIEPENWDLWWSSYERFIDHFAGLAARAEVDVLSIGSELNTTESQVKRWAGIAARARARFSGRLSYSANWDRFHNVTFWELVDYMSVSAYFELQKEGEHKTVAELAAAWASERDRMIARAREYDRPLFLSEVGYPTLPTAATHPWDYVNRNNVRADPAAQARCWRAFFQAWSDVIADPDSNVVGFFGYRWDPYKSGGRDDTGYGVEGKPAHDVIRNGYAAIRTRIAEHAKGG